MLAYWFLFARYQCGENAQVPNETKLGHRCSTASVTDRVSGFMKLNQASEPPVVGRSIWLGDYGDFFCIASRFALNSLPDFHSGNLAPFATW